MYNLDDVKRQAGNGPKKGMNNKVIIVIGTFAPPSQPRCSVCNPEELCKEFSMLVALLYQPATLAEFCE